LHRNASQVMDGLVMATYQTINTRQTVEYVREQHQKWGALGRKKATVMQVCNERLGLSRALRLRQGPSPYSMLHRFGCSCTGWEVILCAAWAIINIALAKWRAMRSNQ
jgi:hypothetical protein